MEQQMVLERSTEVAEEAQQVTREKMSGAVSKREFTTAETVISILCFVLGFVFTHFVVGYAGGLWGGIFWMLTGVLGAVYVKVRKIFTTRLHGIVFGVAELFCLTPLFCTNVFINTLAAWFSFLLFGYLCISLSKGELFGEHFITDLAEAICVQPFTRFTDGPEAVKKLFKNPRAGKTMFYVFCGVLLSIPLSMVVLILLISSDAMFADWINKVWEYLPEFEFSYVVEFGLAFLVWMYVYGAFSASGVKRTERLFDLKKFRALPAVLGYTTVTPICVFYVLYIAVQFNYFTAAFGGSLPSEYSYSSYARQGFFELCIIAIINLAVIVFMQTFVERKEDRTSSRLLRCYSTVVAGMTLLLIASALSKMVLYISEMGMTPLRIYTSWFMLVLAVLFVLIIVAQFTKLPFWKAAFAGFSVLFAMLCFSNVDGMIADYNVTAYEEDRLESVDFDVLESLGDAALVHVERLTEASDERIAERATDCYEDMMKKSGWKDDFAYFSIPRAIGRSGK